MRKNILILGLIFVFFIGLSLSFLLTAKKTTNISWIASEKLSDIDGRMLEIKNPTTREITQVPKMEYYIQMQLQIIHQITPLRLVWIQQGQIRLA